VSLARSFQFHRLLQFRGAECSGITCHVYRQWVARVVGEAELVLDERHFLRQLLYDGPVNVRIGRRQSTKSPRSQIGVCQRRRNCGRRRNRSVSVQVSLPVSCQDADIIRRSERIGDRFARFADRRRERCRTSAVRTTAIINSHCRL